MAAETDTAHEVGFDNGKPIVVGDFLEGFRCVNAEVVDEDVDLGKSVGHFRGALGGGKVEREGNQPRLSVGGRDFFDSLVDAGFGAAIDDDASAFAGQAFGDGETNAGG